MKNNQEGLVKEIIVIVVAILILAYFNIDIQVAAAYIKLSFSWIISLFN